MLVGAEGVLLEAMRVLLVDVRVFCRGRESACRYHESDSRGRESACRDHESASRGCESA